MSKVFFEISYQSPSLLPVTVRNTSSILPLIISKSTISVCLFVISRACLLSLILILYASPTLSNSRLSALRRLSFSEFSSVYQTRLCEEYRKSCFFAKIVDDFPHLQPCFRVKSRCRFVKEQELRSVNKRPCNVNPSALTAAQCAVFSFENFRKVKGLCKAFNSFGDFFFVESVI